MNDQGYSLVQQARQPRIVLFSPQSPAYRGSGIFRKNLRYSPLTLTTLAALIPPELNAYITIIDEAVDNMDPDTIDADLVGITCITPNAPYAYEVAATIRRRGITVVIGGPHPTLMPEEAGLHVDAVVSGYAEQTWPQLLRDWQQGTLQKFYYEAADYRFEHVPTPRRDLLNANGYRTINTVQAVRGCPWKCDFCVVPAAWPKYLHRPIPEVIAEIEALPDGPFLFLDLSPTENARYIKDLYRALIPLKRIWGGLATIRIAQDDEMLQLAYQSGCRGLLIGFESMSPESISLMNKTRVNSPATYLDDVKKIHGAGIAINGCFVLGTDGDGPGIFDETLEFIYRARIDLPRLSIVTPFPNTTLYTRWKAEGRIFTEDWKLYGGQNVVFTPKLMTVQQLQDGLFSTWREVYSLSSIMRRVWNRAALQSPLLLGTYLSSNFAYKYYAQWLPDYMPAPCESYDMMSQLAFEALLNSNKEV